jgi:thiol-disulfide isomerase/thioredoxin
VSPARSLIRGLCLALCAQAVSLSTQAQGFDFVPWAVKKSVPAFVATDLAGQTWRLPDLRGKAVLVNFWASWCEPCRAEMPALQSLAQQHGSGKLVVLAVNFKESEPTVQLFVQRTQLRLPVLLDPQGLLARQWGVTVFPSTVLIGADGRVQGIVRGELDWIGPQAAQRVLPLMAPTGQQR